MENKQFPQPEEDGMLPEAMPELTRASDPVEIIPLEYPAAIEEPVPPVEMLSAADPEPIPEEPVSGEPVQEEAISAEPENPLPDEVTELPVTWQEEPLCDAAEPAPEADGSDAPQADIPAVSLETEVPEAVPEASAETVHQLSEIEPAQEILPDNHAMDSHGMLAHGEEEPPFDMSILNDPELNPPPAPAPAEEVQDQEYRDNGQDFDAMFHAPAPKKKAAELPRQTNKGRPKRKKGEGLLGIPNILVTFVWLALIVMIGVTAGRMLWICAADVLAFGREDKSVTVTIYEADTMDDIIDKLHKNGLIRYKSLFSLYADISDAEEDIKPGIYDLNTRYDYHALVNFMSPRSSREVVKLTIPEGYTCRQIFSLLEENRICTAVDAAAYAAEGELNDYWFLEGVERGSETCLEGYLFPDTYEFYKNSTPEEALEKMLDNFDYRFDEEMRAQIDTLNANITGGGYTVREITIVASLIEKESAAPAESPKVSGVIYNRLFNWGNNPAYLNIDASIVYALGGKTDLTREDLQTDHPYNTYTNIGLTPGPISNPGLSSLKAALNPESHNYYYYVLNPSTGMHQFSTTNEEHNAYVRQFSEAQ
ncbi:MAG: endolytic transglycosylase MltG [Oscillospiraceae bacterium]|nr:endolytic transglycosylase MltG [Oscillospiraceae bacterium]